MAKTAFLGLGVMGFPMAGHLSTAGHEVTVYNRTAAKASQWLQRYNGTSALTPALAARDQDVVFSCVGNDDDLWQVTMGTDGAFHTMKKGAVFVDHTTASAHIARELSAQAQKRGFSFVDAPVSGGQSGAENGKLTVMCGGEKDAFEHVASIISCYAVSVRLLGESGAGQLCKMVNQICLAGVLQGLAEGLAFGRKAGLDMSAVVDVLNKGAAGSWQMENRASTMLAGKFDFGFAVDWMRKDLGICLEQARKNGTSLPVTALIDQFYGDIQELGGQHYDTSSLILRLMKPS